MLKKRRITNDSPHFESGESSQAPSHAPFVGDSKDEGDRLADRQQSLEELVRALGTTTRSIERQVERLEEEGKDDYEAILTLYHRISDDRTEMNAMSTHIRSLEYQIQVI
ncbi:unnamed protein product [Lactuca saligna]|uniref:Uncharacterized protein n=1 Tax=Lactuca saligna TaxID=75948 RepID=A0AA35Y8F7_LACSI|nr:unnamed protein product [Lactuca saligna]